jgi:hypothetical protein
LWQNTSVDEGDVYLAMDHIHIDVGKRDGDYEDDNQ